MRFLLHIACFLLLGAALLAESATSVPVELKDKTWFTNRAATAVIWFEESVTAPDEYLSSNDDVRIIEINTLDKPSERTGRYAAIVQYLPKRTGTVTLPSLSFTSETATYQTESIEFEVKAPLESEQMSLQITPAKQQIYVGEPVRFQLIWEASIDASKLQALTLYPDFFNDSNIEIIIPRNTAEESKQVGLPIGGRRVIATRVTNPENKKALGRIELPLYLRFNEPGNYTLPATRLECVMLETAGSEFARYAAHFNNALFDPADSSRRFDRVYTNSPELNIEVRPLPANETGTEFTGLFAPIKFDISANPETLEIGQLMELSIEVSANAPHGMIEIPALSTQAGLRERFLVDDDLSRIWHSEGTQFKSRMRPLSTSIEAIPALHFTIFDPETEKFERRSTKTIPLTTLPSNGAEYIPLKSFQGAAVTLSNQPEGIWHNLKVNRMNDLLNNLFDLLSRNFWIFIAMGPLGFILLFPTMRERRKRELDRNYRLRAEAYKRFQQASDGNEAKWLAFLDFMAAHFDSNGKAWTLSDSQRALHSIDASEEDIAAISELHQSADARDFGSSEKSVTYPKLNEIAKRVLSGVSKLSLLLLSLGLFMTTDSQASEFSDAEQLFAQAQEELVGTEAANALYQQAALKFQADAKAGNHPGEAWVNSGNAWFKAGQIGRALAAYRIGQSYRPFDQQLTNNIAAARAMTLNDIPEARSWWQQLPTRWIQAVVVIVNIIFWISLLLVVRYKDRPLIILSGVCGLCLIVVSVFLLQNTTAKTLSGVVVVDALSAKKGPSETYANAFNEPLYDGAEFTLIEQRGDWSHVELTDSRQCWILSSQTKTFKW